MNKPIITMVAAAVLLSYAFGEVTVSGNNVTVTGTGNELTAAAGSETQVTVDQGAALDVRYSAGATYMVKDGNVSIGLPEEDDGWKDKAVLWVTAKDKSTLEFSWNSTRPELWKDCRADHQDYALGNYRRDSGAVATYDETTYPGYPNLDMHADATYQARFKFFKLDEFGQPSTNTFAGDSKNWDPSTTEPFPAIKHVMMVFGSQRGGGLALYYPGSARYRAGGSSQPRPVASSVGIFNTYRDTWVDGEKVDPTTTGLNGGWQIISVKEDVLENSNWRLGSADGGNTLTGGQRYGEVLFFTNELTMAERVSAEKYLAKKWGLNYHNLDARLFGTGTANVPRGAVDIGGSFKGTINVAEGAKVNFTDTKVAPTVPAMAADPTTMAWHDPSQESSISYSSPTETLDCQKDLSVANLANPSLPLKGGIRSAGVFKQSLALGPNYNYLNYMCETDDSGKNGKMMRWVDGSSATGNTFDTRMGFMVMDTRYGGQTPFLDTTVYVGPRFYSRGSASDPIFKTKAGYEQLTTNSPAYLNGVQVDAGTHTFNSRGEVLSFDFCETVPIKNFNYYNNKSKTFYLVHGEVLLYANPLTETERKDTEAYLMNKWLGITPAGYGDLSGATVAGAGDVTLAGAANPGFAADYSGAIDATASTTLDFVYAEGAVVNPLRTTGTLALADSVTVGVDFKSIPAGMTGTIVLAQADTITGGTTLTLDPAAAALFKSASIAIENNQLVFSYERVKALVWQVANLTAAQQVLFDHAVLVIDEGIGVRAISAEVGLGEQTSTVLDDYTADTYRFRIMLCNFSGQSIGVSPTYTYAELEPYVNGTLGTLAPAYTGGEYVLPRQDWTDAGLSFAQQLTNAVQQAASGATIRFLPGSYDLGEVYMNTTVYKAADKTTDVTSNTHLYNFNKQLHFVGDTTGHWSDAVTLTGRGRFYSRKGSATAENGTIFEGITFDGFTATDKPNLVPQEGNTYWASLAAAIYSGSTGYNQLATNCVFKNCQARSAGAIASMNAKDCKFYNNSSAYNGGAALNGSFVKCRFEENHSDASGAIWWPNWLEDCDFIGNYANNDGAIIPDSSDSVRNCRFIGNHATEYGGAMNMRPNRTFRGLVFVGNYAGLGGGAVMGECNEFPWSNQAGNLGALNAKLVDCVFSNNYVTSTTKDVRGGAVDAKAEKSGHYMRPMEITNCKFVGNYAYSANKKAEGGAVYGGIISNCVFEGNYALGGSGEAKAYGGAVYSYFARSNGTEVVDTAFVSNRLDNAGEFSYGVAIYNNAISAKCERCSFYGNFITNTNSSAGNSGKIVFSEQGGENAYRLTDCAFTNNVVECGGLVNNALVTGCRFVDNDVTRLGAVVMSSTVYDSVFTGNMKFNRHYPNVGKYTYYNYAIDSNITGAGVDALDAKLYRCKMDGGILNNCVINECVIEGCSAKGSWCVFGYGNYVTNTLVAAVGGASARAIIYRWGAVSKIGATPWYNEFVNCTFADNTYPGKSSVPYFLSCQYKEAADSHTFKTKFISCVFNNNRKNDANGEVVDLSAGIGYATDAMPEDYKDIIIASNCVWGVAPRFIDYNNDNHVLDCTYTDLGGNRTISAGVQRLVKSDAQAATLGVAKYTPKANSPLKGAGDASFYGEEDKDAAGNLRVSGGKVDIGCYQSYLENLLPAMIMIK